MDFVPKLIVSWDAVEIKVNLAKSVRTKLYYRSFYGHDVPVLEIKQQAPEVGGFLML